MHLDKATVKAKLDCKDQIEDILKENNLKDVWKGLKCITGQIIFVARTYYGVIFISLKGFCSITMVYVNYCL